MAKFFLATHGHMASGIKSSLDILLGNTDTLTVFDAYLDTDTVESHTDTFFEKTPADELKVLMSDIYGGSVNQVLAKYSDRDNTCLITGVNLPLVLELLLNGDSLDKNRIRSAVREAKNMLQIVELDQVEVVEEDFF